MMTTAPSTYAAQLKGGYSKVHLVVRGTEKALCGTVPTWDGWTYSGDIVDMLRERFGDDPFCKKCHKGR